MNVVVLTPVRLLGDGLADSLNNRPAIRATAVVRDLAALRDHLEAENTDAVLVDVTQGIDLFDIRAIAAQWPDVPLLALGLTEQRQEVISCGRVGFTGYVSRDASIDGLCKALRDAVEGRLDCPPEIASGLLRSLYRSELEKRPAGADPGLTRREREVFTLLGQGLSNKEIADKLNLSVPTVKHHVHSILEKFGYDRRYQVMKTARDAPWLGDTMSKRKSA